MDRRREVASSFPDDIAACVSLEAAASKQLQLSGATRPFLRVAVFSNHLTHRGGTGITRYSQELVRALAQSALHVQVTPVATWSSLNAATMQQMGIPSVRLLPTGRWLTPLLWRTIKVPKLEHLVGAEVDIVHATSVTHQVATRLPLVVTIHDLGPLLHPAWFHTSARWNMQTNLKYAIERASALVCVSRVTASSLIEYAKEHYCVDLCSRACVIYEGVSEHFFEEPDPGLLPHAAREPFILAVGRTSPRKNLGNLLRAVEKLRHAIPHNLIVAGGDGWDYNEINVLRSELGLAHRVHLLGYVSNAQLHALYASASVFVLPSLFEGFGLPILEAMASSCPVITSNLSSLPEVAGDAAVLVDPQNVDEMADAIKTVCVDQSIANELRGKGSARARRFTWERCASETAELYCDVLSRYG